MKHGRQQGKKIILINKITKIIKVILKVADNKIVKQRYKSFTQKNKDKLKKILK